MTQPKRSLEEIAEELVGPHDYVEGDEWYSCGMAITPGEPERPGCSDESKRGRCGCRRSERAAEILAALREAADAERAESAAVVGALRDLLRDVDARFLLESGFKGMGHNIAVESAGRLRFDAEYARKRLAEWDARSRGEETKP